VTVKYDSWGRVAQTNSGSSGDAGPNGAAWYTDYSYALGRQIGTTVCGILSRSIRRSAARSTPSFRPTRPPSSTNTTEYEGQGNYSRLTGITYPGGTQVNYAYAGLNDLDDAISRMTSVADTGVTVETYRYLGLSTLVGATLPEPSVYETETLDNFGNVADIAWTQGGTLSGNTVSGGSGLVNVAYGYNTAGNIAWRDDVQAEKFGVANQEQTYSYDSMERATGYLQGTFTANTHTITAANATASNSWSLDSQGNRYNKSRTASGINYGTSYNAANQSQSSGSSYSKAGNTTTVTFDSSQLLVAIYDSWGRVVRTQSVPAGSAGPNGAASYTTYSYDALGRQIATNNFSTSNVVISGTQTYYDGTNPIEVRLTNNSLLATYVWSPADGRMILRDAVAALFGPYTGLSISANTTGGVIQRLYPLTDGLGSIVALADPAGVVQERVIYTVDGLPQCVNADWSPRTALLGMATVYASTLGWNWFYRGQQWVQTQPDSPALYNSLHWCGLYVSASGQWYDPVHGTTLQPNLASYGVPQVNPYQIRRSLRFHIGRSLMQRRVGSLKLDAARLVRQSLPLMPVKFANAPKPGQGPGLQFTPTFTDFDEIASYMRPTKNQDHVAQLHLGHRLVSRVAIDHQDHAGVGGEMTLGNVVAARRIESKYHGVLGKEDPQPPAMANFPFLFDENQPARLVGLCKAGLGAMRQQRLVQGLEERFKVLQAAVDRARCQVQSTQPPRGELSFDRLMTEVFAQQDLDPDRRAESSFGN